MLLGEDYISTLDRKLTQLEGGIFDPPPLDIGSLQHLNATVEFSSKPDTYKLYNQDGFKGYFRATWPTWDNYGASTMYMDLVVQYADPASYFKTLATTQILISISSY